jgi:ATP-dependent RNA helicase RhlE
LVEVWVQVCAKMHFDDLGLEPRLLRAVAEEGYSAPTPIQTAAIPHVLAGRDLLGLAQTGTGKTAAFALPMLQRLTQSTVASPGAQNGASQRTLGSEARPIRALILTPTRELASQIGESFATYGKYLSLRHTVIFGGVGMEAQKQTLRAGIDVLIATPGRLLDLGGQRLVDLRRLEIFVLDEADRMLDMGFIHDVKRVIAQLPPKRQTLFFSATMPPEAKQLADVLLSRPETVAVTPVSSTAEKIEQSMYMVDKADKRHLLVHVLKDATMSRVLVFSRTKHGANRIAEHLEKAKIGAAAIHGNKSQNARERALASFKEGGIRVLVATDIAARGIDIDDVTHVVNFDLPEVPETYVHRIGRTARAGRAGLALAFCDGEERDLLRAVERLIRKQIPVVSWSRADLPPRDARNETADRDDDRERGGGRGMRPRRSSPPRGQQQPAGRPFREPQPGRTPAPRHHDQATPSSALTALPMERLAKQAGAAPSAGSTDRPSTVPGTGDRQRRRRQFR